MTSEQVLGFIFIPSCSSKARRLIVILLLFLNGCPVAAHFMGNFCVKRGAATMVNPKCHVKARCMKYPGSDVARFAVPDDKVLWSTPFPAYKPVRYVSKVVQNQPIWADLPEDRLKESPPQFNAMDGNVNRLSHMGTYEVIKGLPRNPVGRTGICERGLLGKWGPNHAADPIVTRWKRNSNGEIHRDRESGRQILQFVSVQRADSKEWAIPGGMVDPGEAVSIACKREFSEEALNSLDISNEARKQISIDVKSLFDNGTEIYKGYVDDPRNTDNAWMETVAFNFHDETESSVGKFNLVAGDDAVGVQWTDIHAGLKLFASHCDFICQVSQLHNAHW